MINPDNVVEKTSSPTQNPNAPLSTETVPVPGINLPGQPTAKQPRNQHLKVSEPKNRSFAARATDAEFERINAAMKANGKSDIVRLMLYAIDLFENDCLTPFKIS